MFCSPWSGVMALDEHEHEHEHVESDMWHVVKGHVKWKTEHKPPPSSKAQPQPLFV